MTRGPGVGRLVVLVVLGGAGAACLAGAVAGCTQLLGIEASRTVDAEPSEIAAGPADGASTADAADVADVAEAGLGQSWGCLGQSPQLFSPTATTTVTFVAADAIQSITQAEKVDGGSALEFVGYAPLVGVPVRACSSLFSPFCDDDTATPADGGYVVTNEAGAAAFTLSQSFDGFYQFDDPDLFTTTYYPGRMVAGQTSATAPTALLTRAAQAELELVFPVVVSHDQDGGVGHVYVSVYDCEDHFAPGVQFIPGSVADGGPYKTTVFYLQGSSGGTEFPSTTADSTDQGGVGGILNVPVGSFSAMAVLKPSGSAAPIVVGSTNVFVHPGVSMQVVIRARTE